MVDFFVLFFMDHKPLLCIIIIWAIAMSIFLKLSSPEFSSLSVLNYPLIAYSNGQRIGGIAGHNGTGLRLLQQTSIL